MTPESADPIAALQQQLRSVLDEQISSLAQQYQAALAEAKGRAVAEAEEAALARIQTAREDFERRLAAESAAKADAEHRLVAETTRLRLEAEQQAAESTAQVREELEHALAAERQRAEQVIATERQQMQAEREEERQRLESVQAQQQAMGDAIDTSQLAERQAGLAGFERLLDGIRALDSARSLTDALDALLADAARATERAALFLVNGDRLRSWKTVGFPALDAHPFESSITGEGLLAQAIRTGEAVASSDVGPAPAFAAVPDDRIGLAVPILVGGRAVALLYADNVGTSPEVPAAWPEVVETLAAHASIVLALLTASRTLQALSAPSAGPTAMSGSDDEQGARRYARLLVSEIKLYNEGAVRVGREKRDLLARLAMEIDRARRLYEERVSPAVAARGLYFQQELVQTLADGDPGLLGNS